MSDHHPLLLCGILALQPTAPAAMSATANDPTSQINGDFAPVRPATEDADA
jgi:hypothetical protein